MTNTIPIQDYAEFFEQLKNRVASSRYKAVRAVNKELILLYHHIGTEILQKQSSQGWGSKVIQTLSKDLSRAFPEMKGFSVANLHNMRRFAELYPDAQFLQQAAGELPWYHHVILMERVKTPESRFFYIQHAVEYGWSRAIMIHQIETNLHNRQGKAVTNFKEKLPSPTSDLANQTLKDPYVFDFLSIGKDAHERELEKGLVAHIEKFLLELGAGFSFVGRQYHLAVSRKDYYVDLLFYHLKLRCFVAIELKAVEFEPEHAGKMNFYLSAIDDLLKHPNDNPSIGLILCKTKDHVLAEYALRDVTKPIGLAQYHVTEALPENIKTALPTIEELEAELSKDFDETKDVAAS
jgi:predicted nuclease of restriction endonuclease-like (RecB) superfamily